MKRLVLVLAVVAAGCASAEPRPAPEEPPPAPTMAEAPTGPAEPPATPQPPASAETGVDPVDRAVVEFQEFLKTNPDPLGLINQIEALSLLKDPRVAKVLLPLLRTKHEDIVLAAVCRAAGRQCDPTVAAALLRFADSKRADAAPALQAAALEGVGEADAKGNYQELIKYGKKSMDRDAVVAAAAFRAAAGLVSAESVDEFVSLLGWASHVRPDVPPEKRAVREAVRPVLIELLQGMTGMEFTDAKGWDAWWKDHRKTWKPGGR